MILTMYMSYLAFQLRWCKGVEVCQKLHHFFIYKAKFCQ